MKSNKMYQILLMTFFGMLGSILIGFIFFNTAIFYYKIPSFQFVMGGLYGALFFSLLEYKLVREQIFGMILILILQLIIFSGRYLSITNIIRDVIYLGSLFLSIKLYHQFISRNPKIKFYLRSIALVLFYGVINTLFIIVLYVINTKPEFPPLGFIYVIHE